MVKLKSGRMGVTELAKYLEIESDFGFELRVVHGLREFGLDCEHGGHYTDPITRTSREFDMHVSDGAFSSICCD
jgi:hypothetical protein